MIRQTKNGRGVFADRNYKCGQTVEVCQLIFVPANEIYEPNEKSILGYYVFHWASGIVALPLGNGMLYNHDDHPNVDWRKSKGKFVFYALKPIKKGDEMTVAYTKGATHPPPRFMDDKQAMFARTGKIK